MFKEGSRHGDDIGTSRREGDTRTADVSPGTDFHVQLSGKGCPSQLTPTARPSCDDRSARNGDGQLARVTS